MSGTISVPAGFFQNDAVTPATVSDLLSAVAAAEATVNGSAASATAAASSAAVAATSVTLASNSAATAATQAANAATSATSAASSLASLLAAQPLSTTSGGTQTVAGAVAFSSTITTSALNAIGSITSLFPGVISNGVRAISQNVTFSGTSTDAPSIINLLQANGESINNANGLNFVNIGHFFGGATVNGPRNTLNIQSGLSVKTGSGLGASSSAYTGQTITFNATVNNGGTALNVANVSGAVFALNTVTNLFPSATFYGGLIGYELDIAAQAGSSVLDKIGFNIVSLGGDAVAGSRDDIAVSLSNQYAQGGGVGWSHGIMFGRVNGHFPMKSTGTMIGAVTAAGDPAMTAAIGIDFSGVTLSTAFLKSTGFTVDGAGMAIPTKIATVADLTNAATDAAAATAGVAINQFYRNGSAVMQRIT